MYIYIYIYIYNREIGRIAGPKLRSRIANSPLKSNKRNPLLFYSERGILYYSTPREESFTILHTYIDIQHSATSHNESKPSVDSPFSRRPCDIRSRRRRRTIRAEGRFAFHAYISLYNISLSLSIYIYI